MASEIESSSTAAEPTETPDKSVLVRYCERSRPVSFTSKSSTSDVVIVMEQFFEVFHDQITEPAASSVLVLQIRLEEWAGEFVDVSNTDMIPDRSVLRVLQIKRQSKDKNVSMN